MALSDEEKATLEALTQKANEPDEPTDFEIEIYDGSKGARIPYSRGRKYLQDHFGIDLDPEPGEGATDDGKGKSKGTGKAADKSGANAGGGKDGGKEGEAQSYWSRNRRSA
jgi:hypothetical protein